MQEQVRQQHVPVKVYRTVQRLMVAAPMAGLEPENIVVEVTAEDRLILHGDPRGRLKEVKELLLDEWSVGIYHRELVLPAAVNARCANVTYGNGVLLVLLSKGVKHCYTGFACTATPANLSDKTQHMTDRKEQLQVREGHR